jgi:hypothetical protein
MLLQQAPTDPIQTEIQDKVKEITE